MPTATSTTIVRTCEGPDCNISFAPRSHNQKYHSQECKRNQENLSRRRPESSQQEIITDSDSHIDFLRKENRRLGNLAEKHKNAQRELVTAVYDAAYEALSKVQFKPISPPKSVKSTGNAEVANPWLSDFQLGKKTDTYGTDICRQRIETFADKLIKLTDIQRSDHPVKRAHVYLLGDIVEGESVFPGQAWEIDASLYKQIVTGVEITADFLRRALSYFETVHVAAVKGNHGRLGRKGEYDPETNMDRLLYKFVSMLFANEPRITFDIPENTFYLVDQIGNYKTLLVHGDQFYSPMSLHSYHKKILGWKTSGIPEAFDDVACGHWHQNTKATLGQTVLRIAGSPESNNTFAQEVLGVMGRPSQHLQFVAPHRGISAEYDVYLD